MSIWKTLLETALYAPSPHNVQPWRLRIVSDDSADLLLEKQRTLPKEDPTGSFIILTMGLFIEALVILAANRSLKLSYELYAPLSEFTPEHIAEAEAELLPFARLTLGPSQESGEYDDSLFLTRRTSRTSYLSQPIPDQATEALSNLAHAWGQTYKQVTEPETIEQILTCNMDAVFQDLSTPAYHDEIVGWFRFSDRASQRTRDGLDYRCMNSSQVSFWLAARVPQLLKLPVTGPLLKKVYRRQLGNVPSVGMLAGPFWEADSSFKNGRFLMRFWLELARHDLYIHPYGNLVTNKTAADWCQQKLELPQIWLVFRIGFSRTPPRSYRRSVEEILVD